MFMNSNNFKSIEEDSFVIKPPEIKNKNYLSETFY